MSYALVKSVHVASAAISIALFVLRGLWMFADSPRLRERWVRIVPHVNDTVLLIAAVTLAYMSRQLPGAQPWLIAKISGLLVYILLGMVALRWGPTRSVRAWAWVAALVVFGYIVAVARARQPWPF